MHAELLQRVGARLHDHEVNVRVRHHAKDAEEIDRFRRGAVGMDALVADEVADRADDADLFARLFGNRLDHIGRGGLAVGAGHAQHHHLTLRISVERRRNLGHGFSRVFHDKLRHVKRKLAFHQQRGRAVCNRALGKRVPVEQCADDAAEQAAFLDSSGIVLNGNNIRVYAFIAQAGCHSQFRKQHVKTSRRAFRRALTINDDISSARRITRHAS